MVRFRSKSEKALEQGADLYETGLEPQSQDIPLTDGDRWPRWRYQRHVYSKFQRPFWLAGVINATGQMSTTFIDGIAHFFEALEGFSVVELGNAAEAITDFYLTANSMDAGRIVTDTSVNVASQAAFTLTCPAGHTHKVSVASIRNSTDVSHGSITYTPNGGTASVFTQVTGCTTIAETNVLLGGAGPGSQGAMSGLKGPLWMQEGDTLETEDLNFGVADVMRHDFIFEDYTL